MFQTVLLTVLLFSCTSAQIINLETGEEETGNFLESGFITLLSATDTITVSTTNAFTYPIVFLSTPFASNGYSDEIPIGARVEELLDNSGAKEIVTFQIKLIWPSNKTCVSEWNDGGIPVGSFSVGWYVAETGGYSVSGVQMEFITTSVNALDWYGYIYIWVYGYMSALRLCAYVVQVCYVMHTLEYVCFQRIQNISLFRIYMHQLIIVYLHCKL